MFRKLNTFLGLTATLVLFAAMPALADKPIDGAILMQPPASPSAERIADFHHMLLYIITGIVLFVLALLIYVIVRFNRRANPNPSQTTHNVVLEVIWTVVPVIILIIIAIPSFKLLYYTNRVESPDMTLKVTGYQWYWGYEYPDNGGVSFQSYMIPDSDIKPEEGQIRLLSTDNPIVLPVNKNIQIDITAADVLHSWAVPSLGVKTDSVPGRLNSTWFRINKPGVYFGQCSELCGKDHAYMPIEIHAVPEDEFNTWVVAQGGQPLDADATPEDMAVDPAANPDAPIVGGEPGEADSVSQAVEPPAAEQIKDQDEETVQDAPATEGEE
jgi:cytochrome c oxidase subunit II